MLLLAGIIGGILGLSYLVLRIMTRTMVDPNEVHVVTRGKKVTSYGQELTEGNVYQNWPSFLPIVGVKRRVLPVNNFSIEVAKYDAYDLKRTPLVVDAVGFFRISDTNTAARRINSFANLTEELQKIMRGALRNILASMDIDAIMSERAAFGDKLNIAIAHDVMAWGVEITRTMEIMDVRDGPGSTVIDDIKAKNVSAINMESRIVVAENHRKAQEAEISAAKSVEIANQEKEREVGIKTANVQKEVGVQRELASQEIQTEDRKSVV